MPVSKFAYIPAPELCQGADEDMIIKMGAIIFPDFVHRKPQQNGLHLKLKGDFKDDALLKIATNQFQILLGILRAWRPIAGQRADEIRPGIGPGAIRDDHGNQVIRLGTVISYMTPVSEISNFASEAKIASEYSVPLRNSLWLNGRRDRNAADFFMVYEYAENDFGGRKKIIETLNVTDKEITRLTNSANNLAPTDGGRHAKGTQIAEWDMDKQKEFISNFLKSWITFRARNKI